MQYTIRDIPKQVDDALRRRAKQQGRSLQDVALEALAAGAGLPLNGQRVKQRDLSGFAGTYVPDPGFEEALREADQVRPEDWE